MMRWWWLFVLALAALTAPSLAAPRDWASVATPVATGSYRIGNPQAKVRLVEYASYTCPHCRAFGEEAGPVLVQMIRSGSLSLEYRMATHDRLDVVAATLARCIGAGNFLRFHAALYAHQPEWVMRGMDFVETNGDRIGLYPAASQSRLLADGAGLSELAHASGMSDAAIDACFADPAPLKATMAVAAGTALRVGTPAFELNGKLIERVGWPQLQPMLRAAGAH